MQMGASLRAESRESGERRAESRERRAESRKARQKLSSFAPVLHLPQVGVVLKVTVHPDRTAYATSVRLPALSSSRVE